MTKTDTTMWLPNPITLPDEHRIFCATEYAIKRSLPRNLLHDRKIEELGAWAVADNSGDTPDTTDDGILWLNISRNIMIGSDPSSPRIPVMDVYGKDHYIITNVAGLLMLADTFRWTINVNGKMFRAIRW